MKLSIKTIIFYFAFIHGNVVVRIQWIGQSSCFEDLSSYSVIGKVLRNRTFG
jgi:hypothetical protein